VHYVANQKTDYHTLAPFVPADALDPEIREKLGAIADVARQGRPKGDGS